MPEISKEWVLGLSTEKMEHALSLGMYHYRSTLLFIHVDDWWMEMFDELKSDEERNSIFNGFLNQYLLMWAFMVFVVQEGFVELQITDKLLDRAVKKVGYDRMRRFRNATFHYQKRIRDARHGELFGEFRFVRAIYERQGVLIRRLSRLVKFRSDLDTVV